jgi:cellulose synthase (UDP-forming)
MDRKSKEIIKVTTPKKFDGLVIRTLIVIASLVLLAFVFWFAKYSSIGSPAIYWTLTFALGFKLIKMLHEWYHYWSVSVPVKPNHYREYTVDILTTSCPGEPREMIIKTLKAMVAVRYPHTSYLCDEGNDQYLKEICDELGVIYVTRESKVNAKAGNINNALRVATGEICIILDPDHVPVPEFVDQVVPYFEDPFIGFVQSVQAYGNQDESFIARGAAEQTYHFYGPMMMCMNSYGTVQAIGANCAFRRAALDSIGGHAAGLSEDMHTAMQLHAKGWKSVYIPEILSRGLVPATLSSYYKQQLKWARGTFELLFRVYPRLFKYFSWRQKIHYLTIPLYFLHGVISLIDILVPVLALVFAIVPWEVNIGKFAVLFLPLWGLSIIIRLYAQRWLLEKHERGFHFAGGVLRAATWWIFLVGFVYAVFNIKVPYIPTPKEDEHKDFWRLSVPNILIIFIGFTTIGYGLHIDWSPYSLAMASYVLVNLLMLGLVVLMSQQKTIFFLERYIDSIKLFRVTRNVFWRCVNLLSFGIYKIVRNGPMAIGLAFSLLFFGYTSVNEIKYENTVAEKEMGGFYLGHSQNLSGWFSGTDDLFSVIATNHRDFPENYHSLVHSIHLQKPNKIPFVKIFLKANLLVQNISDSVLKQYSELFIQYKKPVFLSLIPSGTIETNSAAFTKAWQYLYTYFNESGVSNLTWVWCPPKFDAESWYPGTKFVDWTGVRISENTTSFSDEYQPYRSAIGKFQKPVMITDLPISTGNNAFIVQSIEQIKTEFDEIKSLIFSCYEAPDKLEKNLSNTIIAKAKESFNTHQPFQSVPLPKDDLNFSKRNLITGRQGDYSLMISGEKFYIRGVAYNTQHDWRDGYMPLTRKQLEKDFKRIKEMGANTIRRYNHGFYDRNILNIAQEFDLKVLYGFWFDPKIDYYRDSVKVRKYIDEVIKNVVKYKDHPAVLGWSLGNESWGLLKHSFSKPYLTLVREQYVHLIEKLAQEIHRIDPSRPVFTCIEHEEYQLPGELVAFRESAPSIDVIGINSYYKEQISKLNHIVWKFDPERPYIVSEFGPCGYWDPKYNHSRNGKVIEESDDEKGHWYKWQWNNYVLAYAGYNVGGFAYCWHDRMEGTYTWFGITDYKGRLKKSYYALKETWTNRKISERLPKVSFHLPDKLKSGQVYTVTLSSSGINSHFKYEWRLLRNEYLEESDNLDYISNTQVRLKVPSDNVPFRLYVFADDEKGNVITSSAPLHIQY